ncbi:hypothetical protein GCM10027093_04330 [Paraburkholderia jirisanensis]
MACLRRGNEAVWRSDTDLRFGPTRMGALLASCDLRLCYAISARPTSFGVSQAFSLRCPVRFDRTRPQPLAGQPFERSVASPPKFAAASQSGQPKGACIP